MEVVRSPWKVLEACGRLNNQIEPIEVMKLQVIICKAKTVNLERRDRHTDRQTDPYIELRYAQLIIVTDISRDRTILIVQFIGNLSCWVTSFNTEV